MTPTRFGDTLIRILFAMALVLGGVGALMAEDAAPADLDSILAKPEYNRWKGMVHHPDVDAPNRSPVMPSWLERTLDAIYDWWRNLGKDSEREPRNPGSGVTYDSGVSTGLFSVIGLVILGIALSFLIFAIIMYLRDKSRGTSRKEDAPRVGIAKALEDGNALAYDKTEWQRQAELYLAGGDIRLAFRSLFLGLLSGLHEQRRIVFARNRTNWHYVRHFRGGADERRDFAEMTDLFDRVWYGLVPVLDPVGLEEMNSRVSALLERGKKHA